MACDGTDSQSCDVWETWDYCGLDVDRLGVQAAHYACKAGASTETTGKSATCLVKLSGASRAYADVKTCGPKAQLTSAWLMLEFCRGSEDDAR